MQTRNPAARLKSLATLTATLVYAGSVHAEPTTWEIDSEHFSIAFEIEHLGYQQQLGLFLDASGNFRYDPETKALSSGRVEVEAASIFTDHKARDKHLRSGDFLDTDSHPLVVFEAISYAPSGDGDGEGIGEGTLTGDLTLLDNTHPVALDVTINKRAPYPFGHGKETIGISARTTIQRSRWGMDYGVADNLVGDEVTLRFEFEAIRQ